MKLQAHSLHKANQHWTLLADQLLADQRFLVDCDCHVTPQRERIGDAGNVPQHLKT